MQHDERTVVARLVLGTAEIALRRLPIDRACLTIGRSTRSDLALDDPSVSVLHAVVLTGSSASRILDLGSRSGTRVNGERITDRPLAHGDVIEIGIHRLRYLVDAERPASAHEAVDRPSGAPARASREDPDAPPVATLRAIFDDSSAAADIRLARPIQRVGDAQAAIFACRGGRWTVTHLEGSAPLLNGEPLGPGPHALLDGDLIELGGRLLRFGLAA